jgi:hypothetical protein
MTSIVQLIVVAILLYSLTQINSRGIKETFSIAEYIEFPSYRLEYRVPSTLKVPE